MNTVTNKRKIAILGSTGSIGTQALEVIDMFPELFEVRLLFANNNCDLLIQQAIHFLPDSVVIGNVDKYNMVKDALSKHPIKVYAGAKSLNDLVQMDSIDMVLTSMVGFAGLESTIKAIEAGKAIALANKETLVVAGELITKLAIENRAPILPVDSEHSAIFQCLVGEGNNAIEKIILTASGGPFRGYSAQELQQVSLAQALKHPNWEMGKKITIDSASMMNKGLEMIEAKWLFGLTAEQIEVIIHPQSIVHSLVCFTDGSLKAQMGLPDMRLPIQYAFSFPERLKNNFPRFSFLNYPSLTFQAPDIEVFRNLGLAIEAMKTAGNKPCVLNAANEVAVEAFLQERIKFTDMPIIIEKCMDKIGLISNPTFSDYLDTDKETRHLAQQIIDKN